MNPAAGQWSEPAARSRAPVADPRPPADLHWSFSGLAAAGGSTARPPVLRQLQDGTHDPRQTGFTLQALALAARADFGRGLRATASLVSHIEPDGTNVVELEQAYFHAENLGAGLSVTAGQLYPQFGREMTRHPDDWNFVDVPLVITRLFGADKLRSQGIQARWDAPLARHPALFFGVFNAAGETATSFLAQPDESVGGHRLIAREATSVADLLYLLRWSQPFSHGARRRNDIGVSALYGPNASGQSTQTQILGIDLRISRLRGPHQTHPAFDWRSELMFRRYEAGDGALSTRETLLDVGGFTQAVWRLDRFAPRWSAGLRAELAGGNRNSIDDPLRSRRYRLSFVLTRTLASNLWLRLQYNQDNADNLTHGTAHSLWLQLGFKAGEHGEHS